MSFTSDGGSNVTQSSMISEAKSVNQSTQFGEDDVVGKYCDFEALLKKWNCEDI